MHNTELSESDKKPLVTRKQVIQFAKGFAIGVGIYTAAAVMLEIAVRRASAVDDTDED